MSVKNGINGWAGSVLRVNLTTGAITMEDTLPKYKPYIGGIHHLINFVSSGAPFDAIIKPVLEGFFGEGCVGKPKAYTPINENKIKLTKWAFNGKQWHDSATLCNWMYPMTIATSKKRNYVGDLDLDAKYMSAVVGEDYTRESLEFDSERISQLLRVMTAVSFKLNLGSDNLRRDHDQPSDWIFDKDPDFKPFEEGTVKLDREDFAHVEEIRAGAGQ